MDPTKQPGEGVCRSAPSELQLHAGEAHDTVGSEVDVGVMVLNISSNADSMLFHRLLVIEVTAFVNLDMIVATHYLRYAYVCQV